MKLPTTFMVFDVESVGLHGEGFAVGWVIVKNEHIAESAIHCCLPDNARGDGAGRDWIAANVPIRSYNCRAPMEVRTAFWHRWEEIREGGGVLVADCCWPVEARFLAACVDDNPLPRFWTGPYPLHDLASILLAKGFDPVAKFERRERELPEHHPVADAFQSARILINALSGKPLETSLEDRALDNA